MIFDNSKIKRTVPDFVATMPFSWGAEEILAWYDADRARRVVDEKLDRLMDRIIFAHQSARASWIDKRYNAGPVASEILE